MSETTVKMASLACAIVSIFMVLFGLYLPMPGSWMSTMLVVGGVVLLVVGSVCFAVYQKD